MDTVSVSRIVPYADGTDVAGSRDFYVEVLGLRVAMDDPVLGLTSPANPTAQVIIPPAGMENPNRASASTSATPPRWTPHTPPRWNVACASSTR